MILPGDREGQGALADLSQPSDSVPDGKDHDGRRRGRDPLLTAHWLDPDFDPEQPVFYYVRVIEIPKPRWTAYDARFFGVEMPDEARMVVQDRANTPPIWYTP